MKVIGVGTHSVIWLVEKRSGVASTLEVQRSVRAVLGKGGAAAASKPSEDNGGITKN